MASRRYTYAASLSWGGDVPTAELEVEVSYSVAWGSPETGNYGPPEHYDPGSGDEVEDLRVETIEGKPAAEYVAGEFMPGHTFDAIISKLEGSERDLEAMVAEARDTEESLRPE